MFTWEILLKLTAALGLALPLAWHRERHTRLAGLRTYPLVALGACAYLLIGLEMIGAEAPPDARARIFAGLLSGIGFLGGGAIIKNEDQVKGTASAAAIWIMGGVGAAVAVDQWGIAICLSAVIFTVFVLFGLLKNVVPKVGDDECFDGEE